MYDVLIVGAGPVGCKVGELLGKKNLKVLIIEKNKEIGKPVQCAGLVSHRIFGLSKVSQDVIVNVVKKARFYSKNDHLELETKNPVYVIDRQILDRELAERTVKSGVKISMSTRFERFKYDDDCLIVKTSKGKVKTKILVGADGPNSTVARAADIKLPDSVLVGVQKTMKSNFDSDSVELWFDSDISPELFGWVIPENDEFARVGLATNNNPMESLKKFVENGIGKATGKNKITGMMRYGLIEDSVADRVLLVGDAAAQIKPFSCGGLVYGLIASRYAARACVKALEEKRYDYEFLKENYDKKWKGKLAWPIKKGMLLNKFVHWMPEWLLDFSISTGKVLRPFLNRLDMDLLSS